MEINGVPLHALVVHAAVVLVPLAALAVLAMARPGWRWLARWPALVLAVGAALTVQLAALSGQNLRDSRKLDSPLVQTHQEWGGRLVVAMWVFAAVTVVAFWALPHVTRLVDGRDRPGRVAVLERPLVVVLVLLAVLVLVLVFLTGDAGARAVWQRA